jgi:hypothetical protein
MNKRLHIAGWATLIGFPLLGALVLFIFGKSLLAIVFSSDTNIILQLGLGGFVGTFLGLGAKWVVTRPMLSDVAIRYSRLMQGLGLKTRQVYFLSFCAGFGEELLFRGAIQPLLGIWITAVLFVAIHGYLNPMNWRISIYGVYMTLAIAVLGYLTSWLGIFTACAAHMAIDVVLFNFLIDYAKHEKPYANIDIEDDTNFAKRQAQHEAQKME